MQLAMLPNMKVYHLFEYVLKENSLGFRNKILQQDIEIR